MNWEEIYSGIRSFAGRAATKINQTADMATLQVKLSMAEHKLEEAYAALGKVSFGHFVEDKKNFDDYPLAVELFDSLNPSLKALKEPVTKELAETANEV